MAHKFKIGGTFQPAHYNELEWSPEWPEPSTFVKICPFHGPRKPFVGGNNGKGRNHHHISSLRCESVVFVACNERARTAHQVQPPDR